MKKLTRKEKVARQQLEPSKKSSLKKELELNRKESSLKRILMLIIAVFAFLFYSNTLDHKYVLDDFGIIPENLITKKGISALPEIFSSSYRAGTNLIDNTLYRPLSKAMFAIEWDIAPDSPALSHWMNVIFFSLTCIALFALLALCFSGNLLIPFLASLLFASHPIHTEVVANIKSRDEILCLLFCLLTAIASLNYVKKQQTKYLFLSAFLFFLAFLSKESTITWLAIIPLILYFFTDSTKGQILKSSLPLIGAALVFLLIRSKIVSGGTGTVLIEDNFLTGFKDLFTREVNAIYILGVYLKQLIFPLTLISDGSFDHFKKAGPGDLKFILSFIAYGAMAVYAILRFKKKDVFSFSILYYFITLSLVSNVLFLIGTNYGERLLFIPSLGFCLALAALFSKLFPGKERDASTLSFSGMIRQNKMAVISVFIISGLYSLSTYARNKDWYDNTSLYSADILQVPESVHMQFYYANHISSDDEVAKLPDSLAVRKAYEKALSHLDISTKIHPRYADAYQRKGFIYHKLKEYEKAGENYEKCIAINPTFPVAQNNYANLLFETRRYDEALKYFKAAFRLNPHYSHAAANIASVHGVYGESLRQQAIQNPAKQAEFTAEADKNFRMAIEYFHKAIELDPAAVSAYRLLSVTYANLGDRENADKYGAIAERLQREKK
jgi:tetratricopeptide (TPR) repeat protein